MNRDRIIEFGDDDGPDDMYDASMPGIDRDAVVIRLHEERVNRDLTDGLGYWHELSDGEKAIARLIGYEVVDRIKEGQGADEIADWLDDLREYLGEKVRRRERRKDRDVIQSVITALINEGTLA